MQQISVFLILLLCFSYNCFSQKTNKEKSEELKFLIHQFALNLKFDYEGMMVSTMKEETYLEEKREAKNSRKEGSGDKWVEEWQFNKNEDFPRRFTVLFDKYLAKKNLRVIRDTTATYTLTVKTLRIDPGFHTGTVINAPTEADLYFIFTKSDEPDKILCKLRVNRIHGSAGPISFDTGLRMQECYAKAGKIIAKYILDYAYKR